MIFRSKCVFKNIPEFVTSLLDCTARNFTAKNLPWQGCTLSNISSQWLGSSSGLFVVLFSTHYQLLGIILNSEEIEIISFKLSKPNGQVSKVFKKLNLKKYKDDKLKLNLKNSANLPFVEYYWLKSLISHCAVLKIFIFP